MDEQNSFPETFYIENESRNRATEFDYFAFTNGRQLGPGS